MTKEAIPSEAPLTLEAVQAKFEAWRQQLGKRQPFPKIYWRDVIALQEHYKISKILSTLRITHAQFRVRIPSVKVGENKNFLTTYTQLPGGHNFFLFKEIELTYNVALYL
ncbi:hypothetical protein [Spartinivicinus ruber]|uniref:hypothetical protein n=1 Tax=Spartinivicinus ruber TaxID=2683272 RepID=UPI0013D2D9F6|nr:hypothetical protein [Spartinivicinus ruber]